MRAFQSFPEHKECPICKTNEDKECVLIAIDGTSDGRTAEAEIFHLDCINLNFSKEKSVIYQLI